MKKKEKAVSKMKKLLERVDLSEVEIQTVLEEDKSVEVLVYQLCCSISK